MTYTDLWRQLEPLYGQGEAQAMVRMALEEAFALSAADIYCGKVSQFSAEQQRRLAQIMHRLAAMEPVQYVLGRAYFMGRPYDVGPGVLIPRPETEELCLWAAHFIGSQAIARPHILDICTGSGCIAISLAKMVEGAQAEGWDISPQALQYARRNATLLDANVGMVLRDALCPPSDGPRWHVVVSNPPYILPSEQADMSRNVLDYEPHEALFVDADNPLAFHRSIARYAAQALLPGGALFMEINPALASAVEQVMHEAGFGRVMLRADQYGRTRMAGAFDPRRRDSDKDSVVK